MIVEKYAEGSAGNLPQALKTAQAAIHLPEIQEMLCELSKYHLGIFMPHMHDEQSGAFQPLPDDFMQVESGLGVSFQPNAEIESKTERFLPVGWLRRADATTVVTACEMASEEGPVGGEPGIKHKMLAVSR